MEADEDRVGRVGFAFTAVILVLLVVGGVALLIARDRSGDDSSPSTPAATVGDDGGMSPTTSDAEVPVTPPIGEVTVAPVATPSVVSTTPAADTTIGVATTLAPVNESTVPTVVESVPSTTAPPVASTDRLLDAAGAEAAVRDYWTLAMAGRYETAYAVLLPRADGEAVVSFEEFVDFWDGVATLDVVSCRAVLDSPQLQTTECSYDFTRVNDSSVLRERVETDWVIGPSGELRLANQRSLGLE